MAIEKTTNDFFSGLRHQSDQNFKYDRYFYELKRYLSTEFLFIFKQFSLRRMISGAKEEINRNPKNFIPQLRKILFHFKLSLLKFLILV